MPERRSTGIRLRLWQREALAKYETERRSDFLLTATPGAGKTTFALTLAVGLLRRRAIDRVIVVAPTDHLRSQWAEAAERFGVALAPNLGNSVGPVPADLHGYVTTYAQVAGKPTLHAARATSRRSLVILDEIHHAGDGLSWGEAVEHAFAGAGRRLCLTGTPFRTRVGERIPFVRYEPDGEGGLVSTADFSYGYADALRDHVVRPVVFAAYTGVSRWRNSAGEVIAASLTEAGTKSTEQAAWRTALDPSGDWVPHVIAAMDERLSQLRQSGMPDAAGLVLASDQEDARAYAAIVRRVTGEKPYLILSDDPKASAKIARFGAGGARIAVCVRMVSEGVDVPRAACLAWLTSYRTRCSSPRRWAGWSARGAGTSPRRCSCRRCGRCWRWPRSWRPNATTCCRRRPGRPTRWTWWTTRPRSSRSRPSRRCCNSGRRWRPRPSSPTCCTAAGQSPPTPSRSQASRRTAGTTSWACPGCCRLSRPRCCWPSGTASCASAPPGPGVLSRISSRISRPTRRPERPSPPVRASAAGGRRLICAGK
ncbi:MAG TPA: DEAD/DEAH box helicase family protein [Jatrophihabitans sp.]|nr:DEAD/DEAH box helicase family protein [Jatrophihabitans sp.]